MNPTLFALTAFIAWTLLLLVLMEAIRSKLVLTREVAPTGFTPDNAGLSPFMQRLARAPRVNGYAPQDRRLGNRLVRFTQTGAT